MRKGEPFIVCEGVKDQAFFEALIEVRGLPKFQIHYPKAEIPGVGHGRGAIAEYIRTLKNSSAASKKTGLLVVCDADEAPEKAFKDMADGLTRVGVTAPIKPGGRARDAKKFGLIGIALLPSASRAGQLETLCLEVLRHTQPEAVKCGESLIGCAKNWKNDNWSEKVLLAASLCCACGRDTRLEHVWKVDPALIPLEDSRFHEIANTLKHFASQAGS